MRSGTVTPHKRLGQNFVVDPNTLRRIARLAEVGPGDRVLEVGAGLGSLTVALAEAGATVIAVEFDHALIAPLRAAVEGLTVEVVEADAMRLDLGELVGPAPVTLVANLPYNIATPLVVRLLETTPQVRRMVVMVQWEVGARLAAAPGTDPYGAVSARVAYFATARLLGKVKPAVFVPRPRVDSALVELVRRPQVAVDPAVVTEAELFAVIAQAFAQRRKMLRRSLAPWATEDVFLRAGVEGTRRPEELGLDAFAALAAARATP